MKKNGRKWRRQQKKKAAVVRKIQETYGSKTEAKILADEIILRAQIERENKEIHICYHYGRDKQKISKEEIFNYPLEDIRYNWMHIFLEGYIENYYYCPKISYLEEMGETICRCRRCGKKFDINKISQLKSIFDYMNNSVETATLNRVRKVDNVEYKEIAYAVAICLGANKFNKNMFSDEFLNLYKGLEPVYYRGIHNDEKEILGIESDYKKWDFVPIEVW